MWWDCRAVGLARFPVGRRCKLKISKYVRTRAYISDVRDVSVIVSVTGRSAQLLKLRLWLIASWQALCQPSAWYRWGAPHTHSQRWWQSTRTTGDHEPIDSVIDRYRLSRHYEIFYYEVLWRIILVYIRFSISLVRPMFLLAIPAYTGWFSATFFCEITHHFGSETDHMLLISLLRPSSKKSKGPWF